MLDGLVDSARNNLALALGSVQPLPVDPRLRKALDALVAHAVGGADPRQQLLCGFLMAGPALVTAWGGNGRKPSSLGLTLQELGVLSHWILSRTQFRSAPSVFPASFPSTVDLPDVVQCYVAFLDPSPMLDVWILLLCRSVDDAETCANVSERVASGLFFDAHSIPDVAGACGTGKSYRLCLRVSVQFSSERSGYVTENGYHPVRAESELIDTSSLMVHLSRAVQAVSPTLATTRQLPSEDRQGRFLHITEGVPFDKDDELPVPGGVGSDVQRQVRDTRLDDVEEREGASGRKVRGGSGALAHLSDSRDGEGPSGTLLASLPPRALRPWWTVSGFALPLEGVLAGLPSDPMPAAGSPQEDRWGQANMAREVFAPPAPALFGASGFCFCRGGQMVVSFSSRVDNESSSRKILVAGFKLLAGGRSGAAVVKTDDFVFTVVHQGPASLVVSLPEAVDSGTAVEVATRCLEWVLAKACMLLVAVPG